MTVMSAAVITPNFDFSLKNSQSVITKQDLNLQEQQKIVRWGLENLCFDITQRSVSVVDGPQHPPLSRVKSIPATPSSPTYSVTSLMNSVNTLVLDSCESSNHHRKLDRSQSEPTSSALIRAANVNTSRYKTELCRPFEESGSCKYGDKCQFAHGAHELRNLARHPKYKTEYCRTFHTSGYCPYGPRCHFIHNDDEKLIKSDSLNRPKPLELAYMSGSTTGSPSPPSSLSQSPTSSIGSFFTLDADIYLQHSIQSPSPNAMSYTHAGATTPPSASLSSGSLSPRESPPLDARLPVFNQLSSSRFKLKIHMPHFGS